MGNCDDTTPAYSTSHHPLPSTYSTANRSLPSPYKNANGSLPFPNSRLTQTLSIPKSNPTSYWNQRLKTGTNFLYHWFYWTFLFFSRTRIRLWQNYPEKVRHKETFPKESLSHKQTLAKAPRTHDSSDSQRRGTPKGDTHAQVSPKTDYRETTSAVVPQTEKNRDSSPRGNS